MGYREGLTSILTVSDLQADLGGDSSRGLQGFWFLNFLTVNTCLVLEHILEVNELAVEDALVNHVIGVMDVNNTVLVGLKYVKRHNLAFGVVTRLNTCDKVALC